VSIIWRMSHSLHVKDNFLSGRWWHVAKKYTPIQTIILDGIVPYTTEGRGGRDLMVVGLQLHVQSVPITTKVSLNPIHGEMYSIKHFVIKFVSDFRQIGGFLLVHRFPPPIKLTATI
jgi:hypothetical protein